MLVIMVWMLALRRGQIRSRVFLQHYEPAHHRYRYRLPISYVSKQWSFDSPGWGVYTEYREYLRFSKTETGELVLHFQLDSDRFSDIFLYLIV